MTGVEYYRRKCGLTRPALSAKSGLCVATLMNYEQRGIPDHTPVSPLLNLADALGITLDALLASYEGSDLTTQDRAKRSSSIRSPRNAVSNYRIVHNLRYQELADRLGVSSREAARVICKRETAGKKHILALCCYEQVSPEDFLAHYLPSGCEEV